MEDGEEGIHQSQFVMIRKLIEDEAEAKAIADAYGVTDSMIADAERRLPEALNAGVGISIGAKRAARIDSPTGPFEFVYITYMAGFIEGGNGWSVIRWSEVTWEELPQVADEMLKVEQELLPLALDPDHKAKAKVEEYRKRNRES